METEVSEKTADQASVAAGEGEQAGKSPDQDIRTAGERLSESYEELEEDDTAAALEKWHDSVDYMTRAADSAGRKLLRRVENTVYQRVMTQIAPYYFDNELVSANIQRVAVGDHGEEEFAFEVNINDDELKAAVREKLERYDDIVHRWHVDTEKRVDSAEAAEGVEVTDDELETTTAEPADETLEQPHPADSESIDESS